MEAAEVGSESVAGTSLAIAATAAAGAEDSVMTDGLIFDMSTEITPAGTDSQPPRFGVEYSTDLRKELSLDVLASLGGLPADDDAKVVDESMLDLASVREDMDFISELSSLGPSMDHDDSVTPGSLLPSSTTPLEDSLHADALTSSEVSLPGSSSPLRISESSTSFGLEGLPGDDSSLVTPDPAVKSLSSHTSDELFAEIPMTTSFQPIMNSASTGPLSMADNIDQLSSVSPLTLSNDENAWVADAAAQLQSSRAREEVVELASVVFPASESVLAASPPSYLPLEGVTPVTPNAVRDENSATVEACHNSPKSSPSSPSSPDPSMVSAGSPVVPITVALPLDSKSLGATDHLESVLAKRAPLPTAPVPASLMSANPGSESSRPPIVPSVFEIQSCTPGDADTDAPVASLESYPAELETLPFSREDLPTPNFPIARENSPLPSTSPSSSVAASGDDSVLGGSEAFPSPPASSNFYFSNVSPALNSTPVELDVCPPSNNTDILDTSRTSSSPLTISDLETTGTDIARGPFTPSVVLAKVPPFSDSVASPPLTAHFWDVPSVSPGISLSVYFDGSRSSFRGRKINRKKRSSETGADLKDMKGKGLSDVEKLEEVAELESMLESQKRMVKWQIDEIQRIATLQFQLTGSNPLSEQAMWDVLGVKGGGKKAGDALSPEALKSLQEMFAIKDTLTKKEARDISFTYGASLTQVRDYFAGQRSLVRKLVQQAHDDAGRQGIKNASEQSQQIAVSNSISEVDKDLGFDKISGPESVEKIIEVMRAEKGFAGQIQLMQIILRTDSAALILRRFLEKGALKMLGGWLLEAVAEQQTTVISHLLKVLDHLPMSTAVSHQMQPLVQNVNKLRFHHASAIAGQARSLLSKWVKLLSPKTQGKSASSPGSKSLAGLATPPGGLKRNRDHPAAQVVPGTRKKKVRAEEVLQQESKASLMVGPESPSLNGMTQGASEHPSSSQLSVSALPPPKPKWSSTLQPSESAVAAVSVSRKRLASKSLGDQAKDRRKVMRVEDNHIGKSIGSKPATIAKTSRPLSTDDIYKAKKLERLMQEPILKSKRRAAAAREQSGTQDVVPQPGAPKKPSLPAVPEDVGFVKNETRSSNQENWRGVRTAKSVQEDQPTATRTQLPITSYEHHDIKTTITPTSSQDLFQTIITPTSSQEQSVMGNLTEDTAYKRDSNFTAVMERDPLPSSVLGRFGQELSASSHFGNSRQLPAVEIGSVGVNSAISDAAASDLSYTAHSPFYVSEKNNMPASMTSKPSVGENVGIPRSSTQPSEARSDAVSALSVRGRATNSFDNSSVYMTGSEVEIGVAQGNGRGDIKPLPRETSLSDYYAVLRATMIRWRIPPEYQPDEHWNVAAGEDSKEREVQSGRVKREEEAYYPELAAVPDDPKDPWEEEPDYDDSLTSQIFVDSEQRKVSTEVNDLSNISKSPVMNVVHYGPETSFGSDVSSSKMQSSAPSSTDGHEPAAEVLNKAPTMHGLELVLQQLSTGGGGGAHDPDLLALLLRNPQLVSQLTSGQAFTPSSITNHPGVFMQPLDPLKQLSSGGNNGAGLSVPAGDLGQERLIPSNNSKALGIPLQPGRSVSSVDQTPPETMRVQDSIPMMPHPGMGQQQNMGFVPQRGVDNRFLTPQMPSLVARNIQDTSGWEHLRVPPPPPPVPPTQPVVNQVLQPPLPNQPNKQSNWHESQGWVGIGRPPPLNLSQTRSGPEQLHTRQTLMTHNVRLPNYPGMVGLPQVEVGPETSVVSQPEVHHSQRPWLNGSHGGPTHENTMMHGGQDSGASRNNRWPRPPVRPTNQHLRSGNRELTDFNNGRQTSVVDNRSAWVQNERARAVLPQFQGAYTLPPPPPPPYPAPLWQGQEGNIRLVQGNAVNPFPHGRDLRPPQQQMWNNNMGSASRQGWRGQP